MLKESDVHLRTYRFREDNNCAINMPSATNMSALLNDVALREKGK